MEQTFHDIIVEMGGTADRPPAEDGRDAIADPGEIIHEVGGVRMGTNPANSVLNQFCQAWEVDNLFVTDGGCFVSNADKNPTLSIMAIAWRASDYLLDEMRRGSL
jgi:choline dehydrogenase-like flavoprotein